MGMDIYGENPKLSYEKPEIDWESNPSEEEKSEYFDALTKFELDHPGYYFRNNVWWWRPLWEYICDVCGHLLDDDDFNAGQYNDGHLIPQDTAFKIGIKLRDCVRSGKTEDYAIRRRSLLDSMPKVKCTHCQGTGIRNDEYVQGICNACSGLKAVKHSKTNYMFDVENVNQFAEFAMQSGGFRIY